MALNDKDFAELSAYLGGEMSPGQRKDFEKRMARDRELARMAEMIENLRRSGSESEWEQMSRPAHGLLDNILKDLGKRSKKQAVRIFDSRNLPQPEGVRPATVETRRLKYRLDENLLEISLYPVSPSSFELIGQLGGVDKQLDIEINSGRKKQKTQSNQFGLFRFARLEKGDYQLKIHSGKEVIATVDIDL